MIWIKESRLVSAKRPNSISRVFWCRNLVMCTEVYGKPVTRRLGLSHQPNDASHVNLRNLIR